MKQILLTLLILPVSVLAADLKVGDTVPSFTAKTHEGKGFDIQSRKGKWTVLYFYPKAETPGCTKQACAFRDDIELIRRQDADLFGISTDTVEAQAAFHENHKLNFTLLADPDAQITDLFGSKMSGMTLSKRWTFVIGPDLKIRGLEKDVDPAKDAQRVAKQIAELKK